MEKHTRHCDTKENFNAQNETSRLEKQVSPGLWFI